MSFLNTLNRIDRPLFDNRKLQYRTVYSMEGGTDSPWYADGLIQEGGKTYYQLGSTGKRYGQDLIVKKGDQYFIDENKDGIADEGGAALTNMGAAQGRLQLTGNLSAGQLRHLKSQGLDLLYDVNGNLIDLTHSNSSYRHQAKVNNNKAVFKNNLFARGNAYAGGGVPVSGMRIPTVSSTQNPFFSGVKAEKTNVDGTPAAPFDTNLSQYWNADAKDWDFGLKDSNLGKTWRKNTNKNDKVHYGLYSTRDNLSIIDYLGKQMGYIGNNFAGSDNWRNISTALGLGSNWDYRTLQEKLGETPEKIGHGGFGINDATKLRDWLLKNGTMVKKDNKYTWTLNQASSTQPSAVLNRRGGKLFNKYQQGGQLNEMQMQFMNYLMEKYGIKDESELNALVQQLASTPGESGNTRLDDEQQQFMQTMQQTQAMKNGSKINYLKKLKGMCPNGYETAYYKKGGQVCSKCVKKAEQGVTVPKKTKFFECNGGKVKKTCGGGKAPKACNGKKLC